MLPRLIAIALLLFTPSAAFAEAQSPPPGATWILDLDGAVGPASADYLVTGIADAQTQRAGLIVIRMNTPGGLDGAMRDIIEAILASTVPVATFVTPRGARAASAGTYILYASHIAAMAPASHLGAATPVSLTTPSVPTSDQADDREPAAKTAMERKMINDAAAYIRGLADLRGRNSAWAELAVREAASLSADEALAENVIDLVAENLAALLIQLEGRKVSVAGRDIMLAPADSTLYERQPGWRTELLATITNPGLVLILGMIGFYGIILEFYNPGSLVPGTVGVICLLLAGYALQLLPVNYAGLALLVVGIGLIIAEALSPSFGILGAGGLAAFMMGGIMLFDSELDAFRIGWPVLLAVGVIGGGFILVTVTLAMRIRQQSVTTGTGRMRGQHGIVLADFSASGQVRVAGEIWQASCPTSLSKGDRVVVTAVDGLTLSVKKESN